MIGNIRSPDRVWRNATLDGVPFPWSAGQHHFFYHTGIFMSYRLLTKILLTATFLFLLFSGTLELDSVQAWKPEDLDEKSSGPIPEAEWNLFYEFATSTSSPVEMIMTLKEPSDLYCFYIWQIEQLLSPSPPYMQDDQVTAGLTASCRSSSEAYQLLPRAPSYPPAPH
jgi:hypothetical protein